MMARSAWFPMAILVFASIGCSANDMGDLKGDEAGQTKQAAPIDPVAVFKDLVPRQKEIRIEDTQYDNDYILSNFAFDVTKTDSLISPLVGEVVCDFDQDSWEITPQGRRKDDIGSKRSSKMKMSYAFQEGRWVCTGLTYRDRGMSGFRTIKSWYGEETEKLIIDRWQLAAKSTLRDDSK